MTARDDVTGLVLAGGRGSRMGGVDKGLQMLDGTPLVQHALHRLAPQVGALMINANRNLETYARFGFPVRPDADADFAGPLAGFVAGLAHCATDWLVTVPCDTPRFPLDLVDRLLASVGSATVAVACSLEDGVQRRQPVFCLMRRTAHADIVTYLAGGGRKIDGWFKQAHCVDVLFDHADAFFNANTIEELRRLGPA
ncbi:MAG TPA: molybdenum cofactor guanylyltransferase MobA [Burkholderiaceae bacterium]|nr:molybdenum cofactor guanylyltransferase MobA [Burkholderiaceae bacterium]